jgi:protein-disulfide isomerase
MEQTVSRFLQLLQVPISEKYVRKIIAAHPDFPSLLSIADILQRLGIDHLVRRIKKQDLETLPYPYLLPLDKGRGDILLIKSKQDLAKHKTDLEQWGGVVLQAEASKQIMDKTNHDLFLKERRSGHYVIALLTLITILLSLPFIFSFSWLVLALLLTSLAGAVVGYFIFAKEVGVTYTVVDAFCNPGKTIVNSCDTILKADIHLLGIKFSDAVLTYFVFQVLALGFAQALPGATTGLTTVLAWLSVVTLPILFFSLYYQYFVAKVWCRLCLVVVSILAIQFSIFAIGYFNGFTLLLGNVSFISVIVLALLFAVIGLAVLLVKSMIEHTNQLSAVGANGNRVKHSVPVFTQLLMQQKKVDDRPFEMEMRTGSPDAPIQIIMVSNLFCNPCKLKHEVVDQLVGMYPDKVSVAFRFVKSGRDEESVGHLLAYWAENIYAKENESDNTMKLMHDWFAFWDFEKFKQQYPIETTEAHEQLAARHYAWINKAEVVFTPTFFINGHELPKEFVIDDLLAMAPSLADSFEKSKISEPDSSLIIEKLGVEN